MPVVNQIKNRRDTAANWTSVNPVLAAGEIGYETDTNKFKFGNGVAAWNSRPYATPDEGRYYSISTFGSKTLSIPAGVYAVAANVNNALRLNGTTTNVGSGVSTQRYSSGITAVEVRRFGYFYSPGAYQGLASFANNLWFASTNGQLGYSTDRVNWTNNGSMGIDLSAGIAYGAGLYVTGGSAGFIATSPDLVTWTSRSSGFGTSEVRRVYFLNGVFFAIGADGKVSNSTDGITWTLRATLTSAGTLTNLAFGNSVYVLTGSNNGQVYRSTDGNTWAIATTPPNSGTTYTRDRGLVFGNGVFAAFTTALFTSTDGNTWTSRTWPFAGNANIAFDATDSLFYGWSATGTGFGEILTGTNGFTFGTYVDASFSFDGTSPSSTQAYPESSFIIRNKQIMARLGTNGNVVNAIRPTGIELYIDSKNPVVSI